MSGFDRLTSESGTCEWYTPKEIIEPIREILGGIDLDPASCAMANEVVKATKYYDIASNGLKQTWDGRVFLNPPYQRKVITSWVQKLVSSYVSKRERRVRKFACLVNNATDTKWARLLLEEACAIYFPFKRVKFWNSTSSSGCATQGQMIVFSSSINPFDVDDQFNTDIFNANGSVFFTHRYARKHWFKT